ncbi:MAG: ribonuclease HII [Wenzhouxiangellaceae bacterium]
MPAHSPLPPLPKSPTLNLERRFEGTVCGIDEAGCAPLAGPVVAAAVILPQGGKPPVLRGLNDSKLLSAANRERFHDIIQRIGRVGVGIATVEEIDTLNIYRADMLAMQRAYASLPDRADAALVDGRGAPSLDCTVKTVVKGDRRSLSIAAASVIAKVTRDRLMQALAREFPDYGWHTNAGYGTDVHYLGLMRKGPTIHHRSSFAPLNTLFGPDGPPLDRFRFARLPGKADVRRLELLRLRQDLHAVFDGAGHHLGVVKNLRGFWTFQAIGYDDDGNPVAGGGPCSRFHATRVDSPQPELVGRLLSTRIIHHPIVARRFQTP